MSLWVQSGRARRLPGRQRAPPSQLPTLSQHPGSSLHLLLAVRLENHRGWEMLLCFLMTWLPCRLQTQADSWRAGVLSIKTQATWGRWKVRTPPPSCGLSQQERVLVPDSEAQACGSPAQACGSPDHLPGCAEQTSTHLGICCTNHTLLSWSLLPSPLQLDSKLLREGLLLSISVSLTPGMKPGLQQAPLRAVYARTRVSIQQMIKWIPAHDTKRQEDSYPKGSAAQLWTLHSQAHQGWGRDWRPNVVRSECPPQRMRKILSSRLDQNDHSAWCEELTRWKRPWWRERLKAGREGDDRGWDGWMASPTRWTWVWVSSGSWWWTGRPGVL